MADRSDRSDRDWHFAAVVVSILIIVRVVVGPRVGLMLAAVVWMEVIIAFAAISTGFRLRNVLLLAGGLVCGVLACLSAPAIEGAAVLALGIQVVAGVIGVGAMTKLGMGELLG